ncbi:MAG: PfkB family carbohydrate kinase [Spirochaetia bacterium]|jgi:1-phosphofructokinase|nr:PfkB family carbohydrate kinase [Spirochaetia bacterium]
MKDKKLLVSMTLNPAIDKTIELEHFRYGEMNRISSSSMTIAGKGYHVALTYQLLGGSAFCLGFSYKHNRIMTEKFFLENSLPNEFCEVNGDLRVNLKMVDNFTGKTTEINDRGFEPGKKDIDAVIELLRKYQSEDSFFVFTGSIPPGVNPEIYRDMISETAGKGKKSALGGEGLPMLKGIEAKPFLLKANLYEIEQTFGVKIKDIKEAAAFCGKINKMGVEIVSITLGEKGAVISDSDKMYSASLPMKLNAVYPVGAGTAYMGALCHEINHEGKSDIEEMLRCGIAAASARIVNTEKKFFDISRYKSFRQQVEVRLL